MARALAAVVACMAVVACAGEPSSAPSRMSVESVGASPSEVETFVDPMPDPPELTLLPEGDDFEPVIREIFAFRSWLFAHPEMSDLIAEIYHPDCVCHEELRSDLARLEAKGERIFAEDEFTKMRLLSAEGSNAALVLQRRSIDLILVDSNGRVTDQLEAGRPNTSLYELRMDSEGWRVLRVSKVVDE